MCKTTYTCDHCGKEIIINDKGLVDNGYLEMQVDFMNTDKITDAIDLCKDCADELFDIVENFISKAVK